MAQENYRLRPQGLNWIPCYICHQGGKDKAQPDVAAFVESREAGERVVAMYELFGLHAEIDFRPSEPNWIQVKVGACERHSPNLARLIELCSDNKIDPSKIVKSLNV
jgi:hypothetical protein